MPKINTYKIFAAILSLCVAAGCAKHRTENTQTSAVPPVTGEFTFTALKVGQADALVLQTDNHTVLIDCGEKDDDDKILEFLNENGIEKIDKLFITHFDKDHVGGAAEIIKATQVDEIYTPDYMTDSNEYVKFLNAAAEKNIIPVKLSGNEDIFAFTLDDVLFTVYPPQQTEYEESDNDFSITVTAEHGSNRFLFTGDAETDRLYEIAEQTDGEFDVVKIPHHGRYADYTEEFVADTKPEYAVVTCSDKNPAEAKLLSVLESAGAEVYSTRNGDIIIKSDGEALSVTENTD